MKIEKINDTNITKVNEFISKIPTINNISEELLNKMHILIDDEKVKGIITYETYQDFGLIRYFIFHKDTLFQDLKELLNTMIVKTKEEKLKYIISLVDHEELVIFLKKLGFEFFDIEVLYINEQAISDTVPNAKGLIYRN